MEFSTSVPTKKPYQMTKDEARQKRTADWWRHRYNKGHVSVCPVCGGMTASVTALGHIEHIKYCPFCGKKLQED